MFHHLFLAFYLADSIENWEYFFHTTENQNQAHAIFLQFFLRRYQVIIMIRKPGAISHPQLYSQ